MVEIGVHLIHWGKGILPKKKVKPRGRPSKFKDLKDVHFKMPKIMDDKISECAKKLETNKSEVVRRAVDYYLNNLEKIKNESSKIKSNLISDKEALVLFNIVNDFFNLNIIEPFDSITLKEMIMGYTKCKTESTKIVAIKAIHDYLNEKPYLNKFMGVHEFWPIWKKMKEIIEREYITIEFKEEYVSLTV